VIAALLKHVDHDCGGLLACPRPGDGLLTREPESDPRPAGGASQQVAKTVDRLERASQRRDFEVICDELLTEEARERAGGADCTRLLRLAAGDVRRPELTVLTIRIERDRAEVRVRSTASGQRPAKETIHLLREDGRYRISALGA